MESQPTEEGQDQVKIFIRTIADQISLYGPNPPIAYEDQLVVEYEVPDDNGPVYNETAFPISLLAKALAPHLFQLEVERQNIPLDPKYRKNLEEHIRKRGLGPVQVSTPGFVSWEEKTSLKTHRPCPRCNRMIAMLLWRDHKTMCK